MVQVIPREDEACNTCVLFQPDRYYVMVEVITGSDGLAMAVVLLDGKKVEVGLQHIISTNIIAN